jgi:hypothetical protein
MYAAQVDHYPRRTLAHKRPKRSTEITARDREILASPANAEAKSISYQREISYSGPPPASYFIEFEKIAPGEGQKELEHWRTQTAHRQWAERTVLIGDGRRSWTGIAVAGGFLFAQLGVAVYLSTHGHPEVADVIYRYGPWPLVAAFGIGSASRALERIRKWQLTVSNS